MPIDITVTAFSKTDGQAAMQVAPHWWDARELMRDERFVASDQGRFYQNYQADLSIDEVRELHNRYKNNVTRIQKFLCFRFRKFSPPCRELHKALYRRADKYSHFHINVTEKEAGL